MVKTYGESILKIVLKDNGSGMTREQLQSFFDLGNSTRRGDEKAIGEKGHGTKVYFNSKKIEVKTSTTGDKGLFAVMDEPFRKLFDREIPTVEVSPAEGITKGTEVIIYGYNNNQRYYSCHPKDYILWFTKHGSVENHLKTRHRC